ncbi:MAG: pyridoxal-phosphate dependent enzyme [Halobacteriales archaeon]|nr:pyridoxal-phosphate dependent enzyme [Halobacteriales archaeon]
MSRGIWRHGYDYMPDAEPVTMDEGGTPLVDAPRLADEYGVDGLLFKDESRNPTGSVEDRGASVSVSAACEEGVERVSLYAPGNAAVAVAAYASRAGIGSKAYVPSRARFDVKASVNVHGGDMKVVRGNLDDAREAARQDDGYSLSASETPYRRVGARTVADEIEKAEPDAVVCPVGSGTTYLGLSDGLSDDIDLHAAQPEGCATLLDDVETPDTVIGELEDPSPPEIDVLRETVEENGRAVGVTDGEALDACLAAAREGVSLAPSGGVALAALDSLEVSETDTVVVLNPSSARLFADALRNRMVYHGE